MSLSVIPLTSLRVVAGGKISFVAMAEWKFTVRVQHVFFIPSSISGRLGCFHMAVVNNTALSMVYMCLFQSRFLPTFVVVHRVPKPLPCCFLIGLDVFLSLQAGKPLREGILSYLFRLLGYRISAK